MHRLLASTLLLLPLALSSPVAIPAETPQVLEQRTSINTLLALISSLFPIEQTLSAASDLISAADSALALALGYTTTYNQLTATNAQCGDVTLIYARGTDEPGNVGALVGPELYAALELALVGTGASLVFQGVGDYDATVTEYLEGGSTTAGKEMASLVTLAFNQCPDTKVVMGGYSQGAQIVHLAASALPAATMEKVSAVVTFGDPDSDTAVANIDASKVSIICHDGDDICDFGDLILLPHLTYAEDVASASAWIVEQLDL